MHGGHHHHEHGNDKNLIVAISINLFLTFAQFFGGLISGSLALIADAIHNLSDAVSLGIAIFARAIGRKTADEFRTFGYKRAEVIAALINLTLMLIISLYLIYEAIWRFIEPQIISGWIVIIIAGIALIVDLYTSVITYRLSENNMNMKAAFLHNLSDALASIGVVIAGSLILLYEWFWVDSLITMIIAGYILLQTFKMFPNSVNFLMDATPNNISIEDVKTSMSLIEGVEDVHHIHVWNLDEQRVALEAHVVTGAESLKDNATIKETIKKSLQEKYDINHSTLEFEHMDEDCND
ncbi:MAG: cation diffusion facilitator family transporter [Pseudomonadota bacterium]|nr:cation diffusion facilitator family transporter [Pseudomonadota bacterium]MEE3294673.1 cation diffusion facilitator family transporter [Pseudomonadota bacterium]